MQTLRLMLQHISRSVIFYDRMEDIMRRYNRIHVSLTSHPHFLLYPRRSWFLRLQLHEQDSSLRCSRCGRYNYTHRPSILRLRVPRNRYSRQDLPFFHHLRWRQRQALRRMPSDYHSFVPQLRQKLFCVLLTGTGAPQEGQNAEPSGNSLLHFIHIFFNFIILSYLQ